MRAAAFALLATGCGRLSFDSQDDVNEMDDGATSDANDACAIRLIAMGERHLCARELPGPFTIPCD